MATLSRRALSTSSFIDLTGEAVRILTETLEVKSAGVLELVPEQDAFRLRAGAGWSPGALSGTVLAADGPIRSGGWMSSGEPLVVNDAGSDPRFAGSTAGDDDFASGVFVVVPGPDGPYGVLGVHTKSPRSFDHQDVNFLEAVANTLGGALRQKRTE
ncbi:MAG: GAF domain-containing protein [Actinomycetota bacterium]